MGLVTEGIADKKGKVSAAWNNPLMGCSTPLIALHPRSL